MFTTKICLLIRSSGKCQREESRPQYHQGQRQSRAQFKEYLAEKNPNEIINQSWLLK